MCWPTKWRSRCDHRYVTSLHPMYKFSTCLLTQHFWGCEHIPDYYLFRYPSIQVRDWSFVTVISFEWTHANERTVRARKHFCARKKSRRWSDRRRNFREIGHISQTPLQDRALPGEIGCVVVLLKATDEPQRQCMTLALFCIWYWYIGCRQVTVSMGGRLDVTILIRRSSIM